jgi:hypothetical protein
MHALMDVERRKKKNGVLFTQITELCAGATESS